MREKENGREIEQRGTLMRRGTKFLGVKGSFIRGRGRILE